MSILSLLKSILNELGSFFKDRRVLVEATLFLGVITALFLNIDTNPSADYYLSIIQAFLLLSFSLVISIYVYKLIGFFLKKNSESSYWKEILIGLIFLIVLVFIVIFLSHLVVFTWENFSEQLEVLLSFFRVLIVVEVKPKGIILIIFIALFIIFNLYNYKNKKNQRDDKRGRN